MQTECGKNTKCVEKGVSYTCECKDGYFLEDGECIGTYERKVLRRDHVCLYIVDLLTDINECNHGRHPEVGHYCPLDAECVNNDGGFTCECPENHEFIDRGGHNSVCQGMYI